MAIFCGDEKNPDLLSPDSPHDKIKGWLELVFAIANWIGITVPKIIKITTSAITALNMREFQYMKKISGVWNCCSFSQFE